MAKGRTRVYQRVMHSAISAVREKHALVMDALYERAKTCPVCSSLRERYGFDVRCRLHRIQMLRRLPNPFGLRNH